MADASKRYRITITGTQPFLMHNDDVLWADRLKKWRSRPESKKIGVAGDDRSPPWTWIGSLYRGRNGNISIPSDNLATCLREGGAQVPVAGSKKTFKSQSQSGILILEPEWDMLINGKTVQCPEVDESKSFEDWEIETMENGYELFVKRARIGMSKNVRVRPMFSTWSSTGIALVIDPQITRQVFGDILEIAGRFKGLGDWRPSSRSPGRFGTFTHVLEDAPK